MNHNDHFPEDSVDPRLEDAVRAVLAEPLPEDALARVKARAAELATAASPSHVVASQRRIRRIPHRIAAGLLAAAALVTVVIAVTALLDRSSGRAFAQMVDQVKAATSVQFRMSMQLGRQPAIDGRMYIEGNHMRVEQFDGALVQIADMDRKQALFLDRHRKLAQPAAIDVEVVRAFDNPIDQLRRARSDNAVRIGQEMLDGRSTHVYRLEKVDLLGMTGKGRMLVWIDAVNGLPAKIEIHDPDPKAEARVTFDQFAWNPPLEAGLFALNVPEGFQPGVVLITPRHLKAPAPAPPAPNRLAEGILSQDRVPSRILWDPEGGRVTALMRDPESVPPLERRPHELRQWEVATGRLLWSEGVDGAGWVAGTADGKLLATVIGREMQLRDAATGKVIRTWTTDKPLLPLAFAPDGKVLAAGIADWGRSGEGQAGGVQFWDVERAALVRAIHDDQPVTFLRYALDGKHLATTSNNGPVKLWDVAKGELARIFPGRLRADFSPDGEAIAMPISSPADKTLGTVGIYRLADGALLKSLASGKGPAASYLLWVEYAPDGRSLAATDWNGAVTLWDVATGAQTWAIIEPAGVHSAVFSPNGAALATGSEDKILRVHKVP